MKISLRLLAFSTLIGSSLTAPSWADTPTPQQASPSNTTANQGFHPFQMVKKHWDKFRAHQAFHHLSDHGQKAFLSIIDAQRILASGQSDAAIPALTAASTHLSAAAAAQEQFTAAEAALHPAPQHPLSSQHTPQATPTDWIPVGGEVIASDSLSPEKKSTIATANAQLKAGQTQQAAQTLQLVSQDVDFIIALAPLANTQGAVNRALTFAQSHNSKAATAALNDVMNSLVFVSENVITQATASTVGKTLPSH